MSGSRSAQQDSGLRAFRMDGTKVAVTGGASGIGLAAVRLFAAAGARVVVLDRDPERAREAANSIAGTEAICLDVVHEAAVDATFAAIGPVNALVNCAGIAIRQPALEHSVVDWDRVMAVNVTGSFLCARAAARGMIAAGTGGTIVSTASVMGLSGGGLYPNISYQTSKGAIVNMTRALAIEWAGNGIRVNAVAPTYVRTPFIKALTDQPALMARIVATTPLGRLAEPEEVAQAILFLSSSASAMVTGHTLPVDGGFLAQ